MIINWSLREELLPKGESGLGSMRRREMLTKKQYKILSRIDGDTIWWETDTMVSKSVDLCLHIICWRLKDWFFDRLVKDLDKLEEFGYINGKHRFCDSIISLTPKGRIWVKIYKASRRK